MSLSQMEPKISHFEVNRASTCGLIVTQEHLHRYFLDDIVEETP